MEIDVLIKSVRNKKISPENFQIELDKISLDLKREARVYESGVRLYRGRISTKKPSVISEISYPPIHSANAGRANNSGQPIFYSSAGLPTTFVECRAEVNTSIYIGEWECVKPLTVQVIGFSHSTPIESFLHEIFTIPSDNTDNMYEYSARISTHLLSGDFINGLLYPSIISMNHSHNIAIKTNYVDKFLRLVNVKLFKTLAVTEKFQYKVDEIDFAIPDANGELKWQNRRGVWKIDNDGGGLDMTFNGWGYKATDLDGHHVDPT